MRQYINDIKSSVSIVILIVYSFGYTYLNSYYSRFNIFIENYINLNDLIFLTIKALFIISLIYLAVVILLRFISKIFLTSTFYTIRFFCIMGKGENKAVYKRYYSYIIKNILNQYSKWISIFILLALIYIVSYFNNNDDRVITIFLPLIAIEVFFMAKELNDQDKKKVHYFFIVFFYIILLSCFSIFGLVDGNINKISKNSTIVEFVENDVFYDTSSDSLNYLGETRSYLFIYDIRNQNSLIINKDNITNFRVQDVSVRENNKLKKIILKIEGLRLKRRMEDS